MNCQRFEQVVSDLARGQMMEADARNEALAHSERCEHCLARLRDEETLTRGLRLLAAEMESMTAPDGMELRLREAFRSRQVLAPIVATGSTRSRYWLVAVAAVLLVAMSVAAMWWRSDAPQQNFAEKTPPKQVDVQAGANAGSANPGSPKEATPNGPALREEEYRAEVPPPRRQFQPPRPVHRNTGTRKSSETQMANHVTNEIATDFMPIGDMNPASLQDGGQIVRVKLRRSALVRFGFPVNMDRYNENVKADVLVGVDGLARAIRFVQ
ncbi:MAG TPA: hypothetical protein VGJ37_08010 [Pyrinomonadaceae bacterium]|jgi:hypothetical protein